MFVIKSLLTVLETLALSLLPLIPILALPLFGILRLRHINFSYTWLVVWLGFALPLIVTQMLLRNFSSAGFYAAQAGLGLLASWLLFSTRQRLFQGFFLTLLVLNVSGYGERWLTANAWRDYRDTPGHTQLVGITSGGAVQRLESTATRRTALRFWEIPKTDQLLLRFEARLVEGQLGWDWQSKDTLALIEPLIENEKVFTRLNPSSEVPSISRQFDVQKALSGRTFRATLEFRSLQGSGCGALVMLEAEGEARTRQEICPSNQWQVYSFVWTPQEAPGHQLNILLTGFTETVDIATLRLEEQKDGLWVNQGFPSPIGAWLHVATLKDNLNYRFLPSSNWQVYEWSLKDESLDTLDRFVLELWLERGAVLEMRNLSLSSANTREQPSPIPSEPRQSFWFGHPNLAGHTLAIVGLSFISQALSLPWALVGFAMTASGIWLTGSRTAWLVSLFAATWLLWLVCPANQRRYFWWVMVGVVGLMGIGFSTLGRLSDLDIEGSVSRIAIWRVAWQAFLQYPWTGLPSTFSDYWRQHGGTTVSVEHAHNFWLSLASSYGIAGLIAALWLSGGLLYMAWRGPGWRAIVLVVAVLTMNIFDFTLFQGTILLPLILVVNSLGIRRNHERPYRAGEGP